MSQIRDSEAAVIQLHSWLQTIAILFGFASTLGLAGWWMSQRLNERVSTDDQRSRAAIVDQRMREQDQAIRALEIRLARTEAAVDAMAASAARIELAVKDLGRASR